MRKWLKMLLLAGAFTVLLCGSALAAGESGICNLGGANLEALSAGSDTPIITQPAPSGATGVTSFYPDAVRVKLPAMSPDSGTEYLVFVLELEKGTDAEQDITQLEPTKDNIVYIDQKSGNNEFILYPSRLASGKTYAIHMTTSDGTAGGTYKGKFEYYAAFIRGDARPDGVVDVYDAIAIINHVAGNSLLEGNNLLAADVTGNNDGVDVYDAIRVINFVAGNIEDL